MHARGEGGFIFRGSDTRGCFYIRGFSSFLLSGVFTELFRVRRFRLAERKPRCL